MRRTRNGYTLMEMLLVVGILVLVCAVAIPTLSSMLSGSNLDAAKDTVHTELTKARNKAMEQQRTYKFAVKMNTGTYRIAPDSDEFWGGSGGSSSANDGDGVCLEGSVIDGNLPEKVCFSPSQGVGKIGNSSDWSFVATFLADGTAMEDVQVGIGLEGTNPLLINLKASTGAISSAQSFGDSGH